MRNKENFYYAGVEIPVTAVDRYRCLDAVTKRAVTKASGRITFLIGAISVAFAVILGRLFFLTVVDYKPRDFRPSLAIAGFDLKRKNILDRNGVLLATGVPTVNLTVNPKKVKHAEEVARRVSAVLPDLSYDDVYKRLTSPRSFEYIKRNLTPTEQYEINRLGYYFLEFEKGEKRIYPQGNLFAHVIGTVNLDNKGTSGLELAYNDELAEHDVTVSLDMAIQQMVHTHLSEGVKKYEALGGGAIVMNVNTGEVLSMVSLPDFNPNILSSLNEKNQFNQMASGTYELGSVFKLFTTAAALENKVVTPWDSFDVTPPFKVLKHTITDDHPQSRRQMIPEILIHSSNIGSAQVAIKMGAEKQRDFFARVGFLKPLQTDLPERAYPQIGRSDSDLDVTMRSFGYAVTVSPLQLIAGVAALSNGGFYHTPIFRPQTNSKEVIEYRVISDKTSHMMRQMMWAVVNWRPTEAKRYMDYAIGGKTGTANLIDPVTKKYLKNKKLVRTTFVGVFPMTKPEYAIVVMLDSPKGLKEDWYFNTAAWNAKKIALDTVVQMASYLGLPAQPEMKLEPYMQRAIQESLTYDAIRRKNR